MLRLSVVALVASLAGPGLSRAQDYKIALTIVGGKKDAANVPVTVPLEVPANLAKAVHVNLKVAKSNDLLFGQWTAPGLLTENVQPKDRSLVRRDLHVVLPKLPAGAAWDLTLEPLEVTNSPQEFHWKETQGDFAELWRGSQPILRYMRRAYDNSNESNRDKTYKVFHHVFDPTGPRIVTNGGQTDPDSRGKKLVFPHHRGLMFAFNRITYGNGKSADTWHAKPKDTHQSHEGFLNVEAGQVLGRHRVAVDWHGPDKEVFAKEEREMTVYGVPGGTLLEFASRLRTTGGKVRLDGDPQHAGFQFRAANDVAVQTAKQTYYLRPDGKGKPGETRNWEPKTKQGPVNLPWDAMCFLLDGKRYTVAYLDHPNNPGEKRYSERDYGRFGCYFEYDLTTERPLVLNHRVWLQNGEMTGEQIETLRTNFVTPPTVGVKSGS
jgi:hypothetical protein